MANYKRILLAIDGSDASEPALQEAIRLTTNQRAHLKIVFVVDESFVYHGGPGYDYLSYIAACREEGEAILKRAAKYIKKQAPIKFETELLELKAFEGRIADSIVEEARDWKADILIIGTHGRRGFSHILMGSVAENIVRISPVPVLLVKQRAPSVG